MENLAAEGMDGKQISGMNNDLTVFAAMFFQQVYQFERRRAVEFSDKFDVYMIVFFIYKDFKA